MPATSSEVPATLPTEVPATSSVAWAAAAEAAAPVGFVLTAAALVGFVFFLMELVWYRMLGPILGGSSYTLGLILAVALLGIGIGGLLYAAGARRRRPTLAGFAATCALEALVLLVPFAGSDLLLVSSLRPIRHDPARLRARLAAEPWRTALAATWGT